MAILKLSIPKPRSPQYFSIKVAHGFYNIAVACLLIAVSQFKPESQE